MQDERNECVEIIDGELPLLHRGLPASVQATVSGIVKKSWTLSRFYDDAGRVWRCTPSAGEPVDVPLVVRLLTPVYNPWRTLRLDYHIERSYELVELKASIAKGVSSDDDVLTQFMSRDEILPRLTVAASFADLVSLMRDIAPDRDG